MQSMKEFVKFLFEKAGYQVRKTSGFPFGVDFWIDVQRLSACLNRPIEVVFDVGANNGDTSKNALKCFPNSHVYAFEPHPKTYASLTTRIKHHAFTPIKLALSDKIGQQVFFEYGGSGHVDSLVENARFSKRFNRCGERIQVEVDTVDNFCQSHNVSKINLLKVDTEGNDYATLRGAKRMLNSSSVDFIYFEFNDFMPKLGTSGGAINEISTFLSAFDFHFLATYTDYVVTEGELFVVANALVIRGSGQT
jgi:FkbM family methyltransferase